MLSLGEEHPEIRVLKNHGKKAAPKRRTKPIAKLTHPTATVQNKSW